MSCPIRSCQRAGQGPSTCGPVCVGQVGVPNNGSGQGLGSNEVAVVYEQASSFNYSWFLSQQSKLGAIAGQCAAAQSTGDGSQPPRRTGVRRAPVFSSMRCAEH